MTKLKVRNFGPIKQGCSQNDGFFEIPKLTLFIGNQGSGKSTVAKLISTFMWMEKVLFRGDYGKDDFDEVDFVKTRLVYHRIASYLKKDTELFYAGEKYAISYVAGKLHIEEVKNTDYELPQIMYVSAERVFIASVENAQKVKNIPAPLRDFLSEYAPAKKLDSPVSLPINNTQVSYDQIKDIVWVNGTDYTVKLEESSSGFQSLVPLYLVSRFLCNNVKSAENSETMSEEERKIFSDLSASILSNTALNEEQKRIALSEAGKKFNKSAFINIVEEPELNLFPSSQWQLLQSLLAFNNTMPDNKLILTTHSPYLINYLTIAVKAAELQKICKEQKNRFKLDKIVAPDSVIHAKDVAIYELNESDGTIHALKKIRGLPSDENLLNNNLGETDELFAQLLEVQQKCV